LVPETLTDSPLLTQCEDACPQSIQRVEVKAWRSVSQLALELVTMKSAPEGPAAATGCLPRQELLQQGQEVVVQDKALGQGKAPGLLGQLMVHFAPSYFPRQGLVFVVCRDVSQRPTQTGQHDVEIVENDGDTSDVNLRTIGEVAEQSTRSSYLLGQTDQVAVECLWKRRAQLIQPNGDQVGPLCLPTASLEEMHLDGWCAATSPGVVDGVVGLHCLQPPRTPSIMMRLLLGPVLATCCSLVPGGFGFGVWYPETTRYIMWFHRRLP